MGLVLRRGAFFGGVLHLVILFAATPQHTQAAGKYDPCNAPGLASRGNGFFVGLAFWPGGSAEDWGAIFNATTGQFGLHPCNTTGTYQKTAKTPAAYLASKNVSFAAFEVKVDTLVSLNINYTDISASITDTASYVSAIAFRGPFRSEPAYIYSGDSDRTHATGHVLSLSLTMTFARGNLTGLRWSDYSCNTCGGPRSQQCLVAPQPARQQSCIVASSACSGANATDCSLSVYGGFAGSDRHGQAFTSAGQLSSISSYALSTYFYDALEQLLKVKQAIMSTGDVGDAGGNGQSNGDAA